MVDFAIIGVQKAGTSSMHRYLESHDAIRMPHEEYAALERAQLASAEKLSVELNRLADEAKANAPYMFGIKRPSLFAKPKLIAALVRKFPNIKLISLLRRPRDRIIAGYFHYMRGGHIPILPIGPGLRRCLSAYRAGGRHAPAQVIAYSLYGQQYGALQPIVDLGSMYLEDYKTALSEEGVRQVCDFLGVDAAGIQATRLEARDRQIPQKVNYSIASLRLTAFVETARERLNAEDREELTSIARRAWAENGMSPPSLSPELEQELADIIEPDVEAFETALGRQFPTWR